MNLSTGLMIFLGLIFGTALGVFLHWGWLRRHAAERLRVPTGWLLHARGLVTSEEQEVWKWLRLTFQDHVVMVKVSVMRFTIPSTKNRPEYKDQHWHELLNGVYCTFTVSTLDGKVVGCVDVPGKRGLSRAQREMKESLLLECGIGYTAVRSSSLPSVSAMRTAFLGEAEIVQPDVQETRGGDSIFHAALDAFSGEKVRATKEAAMKEIKDKQAAELDPRDKNRDIGFNPDGTGSFIARKKPDRFSAQWEDSFTMPPDTRPAKIP